MTGSTRAFRSSTSCGSFFLQRRPAGARLADAVGGPIGQAGVEFLPSAADGIDVQASDKGDAGVAAVAELVGLQGGQPAALLLVETAEQQVHAGMQLLVGVRFGLLAHGALARMHVTDGHVRLLAQTPSEEVKL